MGEADELGASPQRARSWLAFVGSFAALVGYLTWRDLGATAYDDSYFFKRFAINALDHGVYAWNVADGPVFGSTSQLFQLVTTGVTAVTRSYFVVGVRLVNALALVGTAFVLVGWAGRVTRRAGEGQAVVLLALGSPIVLATVITGMETAVALLVLAGVMTRLVSTSGTPAWQAAMLTVLVYACRPDAAVVPAAFVVVDGLMRRRLPLAFLAWLAGGMAIVWATAWAYYGTPLPLSFYMKTLALDYYGAHMVGVGWHGKQLHFGVAVALTAPLVWIVVRSGALRRRGPAPCLLIAAGCLWAYHLVSTNEIMGYRGRFYLPAVVPLAMAAVHAWDAFAERSRTPTIVFVGGWAALVAIAYATAAIPTNEGFFIARLPWPAYAGVVVAGSVVVLRPRRGPWFVPVVTAAALAVGLVGWKPPQGVVAVPTDAQVMRRHAREVTTARGVFDVARCLPPGEAVYHSELGVTGLVLLDRRVVDLAGILSRGPGIDREPFQAYCSADRPEAIFLPHRNYRVLNAEIRESPCFFDYRRVVDRSSSPLFVRADLYDGFMACATQVHRWRRRD